MDTNGSLHREIISKEQAKVEIINSIAVKHKDLRSKSKAPTFALTYAGTYSTLVKNCNLPLDEALAIEKSYHELYKVSDEYCEARLNQAAKDGYATVAFGLKIRCYRMKASLMGDRATPKEAQDERRTINNAFGQSYGLLTTRALVEFMRLVRANGYQNQIRAINSIHDALYFEIDNDLDVLAFCNEYLPKCFSWQELPELKHEKVHLSGELELFYPSWAKGIPLSSKLSKEELKKCLPIN